MSPIIGFSIATFVIAFCMVLSPDAKPKPKTDAQKLEELIRKMSESKK